MATDMHFNVSKEYADYLLKNKKENSGYKIIDGEVKSRVSVIWFTKLDVSKRHEELVLYEKYCGNKKKYSKYDNYDAINVDKVCEILMDYKGVMGVRFPF